MNAESLELGATYFRITYADVAQTMPGVEPVVFVGVDIFGEPIAGEGTRYYFQDAVSVTRFGLGSGLNQNGQSAGVGSGLVSEDDLECLYSAHEATEIGEVIVDLPMLASEIDLTIKRAKSLGFPRLTKAKGTWI